MAGRKEYPLRIKINGRDLTRIIIDQHYKQKHAEVTDELILELVKQLDGGNYPIEAEDEGFEYFRVEPVFHKEEPYRVILVLCITDDYLGVVNAFRVGGKG